MNRERNHARKEVVVITGASAGVGRATVREFASSWGFNRIVGSRP